MEKSEALKILIEHQKWRRGEPPYVYGGEGMPHSPKQLGQAIDIAIGEMRDA